MSTPIRTAAEPVTSSEVKATTIPVDKVTTTGRTVIRTWRAVSPGDTLLVHAEAGVTNDCGYDVGVGWHLWYYDMDNGLGSSGDWYKIGLSMGDNVTPDRHHMPLYITRRCTVPDTWVAGRRMALVLRVDAHSTAARSGDVLTVETYGEINAVAWVAAEEVAA